MAPLPSGTADTGRGGCRNVAAWKGSSRPALRSVRGGRRLLIILALLFEGSGGVLGGDGGRWVSCGRRRFGSTGGRWFSSSGGGQLGCGYCSRRRRGWRASRHRTARGRGGRRDS